MKMSQQNWRWIAAFCASSAVLAGLLLWGQAWFAPANFEFGAYRSQAGTLAFLPYPALLQNGRWTLLTGSGKWGAEKTGPNRGGAVYNLRAAKIYRPGGEMLEVEENSWAWQDQVPSPVPERIGGEWLSLWGEIADSKCFLGVMNPGAGTVHRECAVRCLSGGVPPIFVARDRRGAFRVFWLAATGGQKLSRTWLTRHAGRRLRLGGRLVRRANLEFFEVDPPRE